MADKHNYKVVVTEGNSRVNVDIDSDIALLGGGGSGGEDKEPEILMTPIKTVDTAFVITGKGYFSSPFSSSEFGFLPSIINHVDTSNAESLSCLFRNNEWGGTLDISKWDVSKVTDFSWMFLNSQFEKIILPNNFGENTNSQLIWTGMFGYGKDSQLEYLTDIENLKFMSGVTINGASPIYAPNLVNLKITHYELDVPLPIASNKLDVKVLIKSLNKRTNSNMGNIYISNKVYTDWEDEEELEAKGFKLTRVDFGN